MTHLDSPSMAVMPEVARVSDASCSRPLRVLYVQGAPDRAGAETVLVGRLRHLAAAGVEPAIASLAQGPFVEELRDLGVHVEVLASSSPRIRNVWRLPSVVRQIAMTVRRLDADIIDGWCEKMSVLAGWAGRLAGRPVVLTLHDAPRRSPASTAVQLAAVTGRHDAIVVPSRWMSDGFRKGWHLRTHVISNGLAIETLPKRPAPIRADVGWPEDALLIGIFGRLVSWKGQLTFLRAAREVLAREPRARFLVVGGTLYGYEAPYAEELRATVTRLGLADHVHFTGHRADQLDLMLACDVVCHASVAPEPFGLVVAEAMALGRPVVATHTGGPDEIVVHGKTGLLVAPGDQHALAEATLALLGDHALRRRLGDTGRRVARSSYDAGRVTHEVVALYRRVART